jgi:hypothetical protein
MPAVISAHTDNRKTGKGSEMTYPASWSQFQSAGQGGFGDTKETLAEDIRARVRKHDPRATMETLERMSRNDLATLMHALMDAENSK